uniref:Recep_L_domain domain-containing protein n=1 Tax=Caenorhabditis tropicalis TaxID=1561998 RepID=A0A1I7UDT7_9PELO
MIIFLENKIFFVNIDASYCEHDGDLSGKLCEFKNMTVLAENCDFILGEVRIESGDEKHTRKLSKVTHIFGKLIIQDTTLTNVKFLESLTYMASLTPGPVIQIVSNANLVNIKLPGVQGIITKNELQILIHGNNPKLFGPGFYLFGYDVYLYESYIGGDNGCPSDKLNVLGPKFFETCTVLSNGLKVTNSSPDLDSLSNIKILKGEIEISNTNLSSLSFLENLKTIDIEMIGSTIGINVDIHHNPEMKYLGLKALKKILALDPVTINLELLHPDFCVTIQEMLVFLEARANFRYLHAKFCDFNASEIKEKTCKIQTLGELESGCIYIFGDVFIDAGDEEYVPKLEKTTVIFGSLSIQNTELHDLKFLKKLRKMASLNESLPIIQIMNNKNLRDIELPNIDGTISKGYSYALISGRNVFKSTKACMIFQHNTRTNVSYNGENCREFESINSNQFSFQDR